MKIALVSGIPLFPVHEGSRSRILALSRAIRAQGHDLWFVVLPAGISHANDRERHIAEFGADRFIEIPAESKLKHFVRRLPLRIKRKLRYLFKQPSRYYSGLDDFYLGKWTLQLSALHRRINFDAAVVEYVFHSAALLSFPQNVRKIIDTHDAFADRHHSYIARGLRDYWISLRPADESRGFRRADIILAIQEQEALAFSAQMGDDPTNPDVAVVNHFLDLSSPPIAAHTGLKALFLASGNAANTLSARNFIENVLPIVLARLPQFQLVLAGAICEVIDDHPSVVKLGQVERVMDAFRVAPVLVNPMLLGTGINIKILDAMASGVPIISTEMGIRGLPEDYRAALLSVPDRAYQAFADQIITLMENESMRRQLGQRGRIDAARWNEQQEASLRAALEDCQNILPQKVANEAVH